ncbi:MAG: 30S ribosome-binding factor RbfA [Acidobacteria bacterium]|nr:30S ribosome-binding factor RbfA [Acidobacteriota bacterium]
MSWNRTERLTETVRQEISGIIEYELVDERIGEPKVTEVKVSSDLRNATVYVDIDGGTEQIKESLNALRHAAGFIRHQLSLRIQLKRVPELFFQYDDSRKKAARIEQLLGEEIEKEQNL